MVNRRPWLDRKLPFGERASLLLSEMTTDEKLTQLNWKNKGISRLGIPPYVWCSEGLHGVARAGAATVFPQPIGMAATFSTERIRDMARILTREARARHHESIRQGDRGTYKGVTYWAPNINIFRDPRWGRGHETYGEDPFLTASLGATFVEEIQRKTDQYLKLAATPKHFAVHSGPELDRLSFNSVVEERDLRETYLPAFHACIKAGARSIMTAYNAINGKPCALNDYLVQTILRKEWGFDGVVVTDGGAGEALYKNHKVCKSYGEAVCSALANTVDVMTDWEDASSEAQSCGKLSINDLDRAIWNQLRLKFELGLFDSDRHVAAASIPYETIESPAHRSLARNAAAQSFVLLRNRNQTLPLRAENLNSIAVIGPNADSREVLLGNYHGTPSHHTTILEGIQQELEPRCRVWHARGCEHLSYQTEACAEENDRYSEAVAAAQRSDVVILCLGLTPQIEGEAGDAFNAESGGDRISIELPAPQETLIRRVSESGKPIIILLLAGSSLYSPLFETHCDALIQCWYPGAEGGQVIAEMLLGKHNPSGRLPVTFYKSTNDLPEFTSYAMEGRTYRFFQETPAYPFGFGLSYSEFSYHNLQLSYQGSNVEVTVTVENHGPYSGEEIVQVYATQEAKFRTPLRRLVAFERISLDVSKKRDVSLKIDKSQLVLTDPEGNQDLHPGNIVFSVGGIQPDQRSAILSGNAGVNTLSSSILMN